MVPAGALDEAPRPYKHGFNPREQSGARERAGKHFISATLSCCGEKCFCNSPRDTLLGMRHVLFLVLLICGLWAFDKVAFDGRNGTAVWSEANYKAKMFQYEVDYWLKRNLGR